MSNLLNLGMNAFNGFEVLLSAMNVFVHWMIVGGSGKGKSRLLANLLRYCIDRRIAVIVLDPGEELYRWGLSYALDSGNSSHVCSIDLNDLSRPFGFDWTRGYGVSENTVSDQFYRCICKAYGQPDEVVAPLTETWMRNTLMPLIECPGATFAEMLEFATPGRSALREAILAKTQNKLIRNEWTAFESLKRSDQEHLIMAVHNRAAKLVIPDEMRRLFGQENPAFDLAEAIEQRKTMLLNLAPINVSREAQRVFGITFINGIVNYAPRRTPAQRRNPVVVICDEANMNATDDLPAALDTLRKFGIFFVLSYQTLAQVEKIPGYLDSLFTNTNVKVAFRTSRMDAEKLVGEMYPEGLIRKEVKDEIVHTAYDPVESTRTVKSRSRSRSETSSHSEGYGSTSGMGHGGGYAFGLHEPNDPDSLSPGSSSVVFSQSDFQSDVSSESSSSGRAESESESEGETVVPFYEYLARTEVSSRTFYSVEELRERYISRLLLQPIRHAQVRIAEEPTIPLETALVEDIRVRDRDRQRVVNRSNRKYTLPAEEVDRQIEERRARLLAEAEAVVIEKEEAASASRWH